MMTISVRLSRKRIVLGMIMAVALLAGIASFHGTEETQMTGIQATAEIQVQKGKTKTNEDRVQFLQSLGWEIESEPLEIVEIVIPNEMNEVYQNYNALQKEQGFDLTKYGGKKLKRYTYKVCNYPDQPEFVQADLLIYRDTIVGGDVCSTMLDGFMQGLGKSCGFESNSEK